MKTLTIRDFRTRPRAARETLRAAGEALLTLNGRPIALLLAVGDDVDEAVALAERVRAQRAVAVLRTEARTSGADRLSSAKIAALVGKSRRARRRLQA